MPEEVAMLETQERYLTPAEVAVKLRRCDNTVWRWLRSGKLKAIRIEGRYLVPEASVVQIMEQTGGAR